jgi:hypothetical protein
MRSSPDSVSPSEARNSARSAGSSSASSASTLAENTTTLGVSPSVATVASSARLDERVAADGLVLADVGGIEHRLGRQQIEAAKHRCHLVGRLIQSGGFAGLEQRTHLLDHRDFRLGRRVVGACHLLRLLEALVHRCEVRKPEFDVDDLAIASRVGRAHHVLDVRRPRSTGSRARSRPPRGCCAGTGCRVPRPARTLDQASDVDELHRGRHHALRLRRTRRSRRASSGTVTTPVFGSMVANG